MKQIHISLMAILSCIISAQVFAATSSEEVFCKKIEELRKQGIDPYTVKGTQVVHRGTYNNTDVMFLKDGAIIVRPANVQAVTSSECNMYKMEGEKKIRIFGSRKALQSQVDEEREAIINVIQSSPEEVKMKFTKTLELR